MQQTRRAARCDLDHVLLIPSCRSAASAGRSARVCIPSVRARGARHSGARRASRLGHGTDARRDRRTRPTRCARVARQGWQPSQIFFILGSDAFAEIATWREFPAVLDAANFVVIARPGTTLDAAAARRRAAPALASPSRTRRRRYVIFLVEARTRDVSSSAIRARLAARQPIDDLGPRGGRAAHRRASFVRSGRRLAWPRHSDLEVAPPKTRTRSARAADDCETCSGRSCRRPSRPRFERLATRRPRT